LLIIQSRNYFYVVNPATPIQLEYLSKYIYGVSPDNELNINNNWGSEILSNTNEKIIKYDLSKRLEGLSKDKPLRIDDFTQNLTLEAPKEKEDHIDYLVKRRFSVNKFMYSQFVHASIPGGIAKSLVGCTDERLQGDDEKFKNLLSRNILFEDGLLLDDEQLCAKFNAQNIAKEHEDRYISKKKKCRNWKKCYKF